ncbi:MAG: response regulator [Bacillota bacterium]
MKTVQVLIVEDDPMVAHINKQLTEKVVPFKVVGICTTEEEAINAIAALKPDLVLLDIYLPSGSGLSLLQAIRQQDLPSDVILITAAKDISTVSQALRHGAIDYIIKPFDLERLEKALKNYLRLRSILAKDKDLSQEDLDNLNQISSEKPEQMGPLPKGVHSLTLDQIMSFLLKQVRALSCQQIASALSMSKITVWRYLEYLVAKGKIKVELEYGTKGRPTKLYYANNSEPGGI